MRGGKLVSCQKIVVLKNFAYGNDGWRGLGVSHSHHTRPMGWGDEARGRQHDREGRETRAGDRRAINVLSSFSLYAREFYGRQRRIEGSGFRSTPAFWPVPRRRTYALSLSSARPRSPAPSRKRLTRVDESLTLLGAVLRHLADRLLQLADSCGREKRGRNRRW